MKKIEILTKTGVWYFVVYVCDQRWVVIFFKITFRASILAYSRPYMICKNLYTIALGSVCARSTHRHHVQTNIFLTSFGHRDTNISKLIFTFNAQHLFCTAIILSLCMVDGIGEKVKQRRWERVFHSFFCSKLPSRVQRRWKC